MNAELPDHCVRGIPHKNFIYPDDSIAAELFLFHDTDARADGWIEQSINWNDNEDVFEFTLNQTRENGEIQFKAGLAVIPRGELDRLSKQPTVRGVLSYERQPLNDNPYHGNLLLKDSVPKLTRKKIAAGIALIVSQVILR